MKVFTKKGIIQKIIILIIFVILFNFIVPNISLATGDKNDNASEIFGRLFSPIKELLLGVTDAVIWGIQYIMYGVPETFKDMRVNESWSDTIEDYKQNTDWSGVIGKYNDKNSIPRYLRIPKFYITPGEIFSDNIPLLDVNFFNPYSRENIKKVEENGKEEYYVAVDTSPYNSRAGSNVYVKSSAIELQPMISKWYYALRNLAIVALLSILVYIAIRIIISSTSEDKAKYKSRLMDWIIAMCLIFTMHYIMSFAVTLNNEIVHAVSSMNEPYNYTIQNEPGDTRLLSSYEIEGVPVSGEKLELKTNLMEKARLDLQLMPKDYTATQKLLHNFGYIVIYMGLVMYTVLFLFRYFKRVIILAFLTIIAPLVAMTYPLDKIHDNKAEGFNRWLKEYIFNLLIQPVHLILYTVLIGTAMDFAGDNILYSLVAFGFILQAEKLMMKFFGFNKASTVSNTSAALGGALAMKGVNALTQKIGGTKKQAKGNKQESGESKKIAQANRKPDKDINELMDSVFGATSIGLGGGSNNPPQNTNPTENNTPTPNTNPVETNTPNANPVGTGMPIPDVNPVLPNFPEQDNNSEIENITQTDYDSEGQDVPIVNNAPQENMEGGNSPYNVPDINSQNFEGKPDNYNENGTESGGGYTANFDAEEAQNNNGNSQENYEHSRDNMNRPIGSNSSNEYQAEIEAREKLSRLASRGQDLSSLFDDLPSEEKRTLTMPERIGKGIKYVGPKVIGGVAKGLVKGTLTAGLIGTGATIGLTAGLVSDNFGNVPKYTLAGAGATVMAGKGIVNKASNIKNGISEEYDKYYEATHTSEEVHAREDRKALNNKERVKKYQEEFKVSKEEARRIIREEAQRYREYGIKDDDIIIKAMKTKEFGESRTVKQRTSKERILLAKMASQVEGKEDRYKRLKEGLKDRGVKNQDANKYLRTIRMFNNWI